MRRPHHLQPRLLVLMKGQVVSWDCGALNFALRARARTSHTAREIRKMSSEPKIFVSRSGGAVEQEPDDHGKFVVELNVAYGDKQDDGGNGLVESARAALEGAGRTSVVRCYSQGLAVWSKLLSLMTC
jgi:hypothetical protein